MRSSPPAVKPTHILVGLSENYGYATDKGKAILLISYKDLADVTEIGVEETTKIMEKLLERGWLEIDSTSQLVYLINFKQLINLAGKVSYSQ
jgi:CRP/FNR family cyclic AMP-dependent transcriptional regulator